MEILTKNEEEIMQILWSIKKGFVKDVLAKIDPPVPPYNTVSSIIRVLEKKGFVDHNAYGKTHEYFPVVSKAAYRKFTFRKYIANYFGNSPEAILSYMVKEEQLSPEEIREMLNKLDKDIDNP